MYLPFVDAASKKEFVQKAEVNKKLEARKKMLDDLALYTSSEDPAINLVNFESLFSDEEKAEIIKKLTNCGYVVIAYRHQAPGYNLIVELPGKREAGVYSKDLADELLFIGLASEPFEVGTL
jgi:hypothetical protein